MSVLDDFDIKILKLLQEDSSLQMEEIAHRVGLSASPCWRRIKRLEAEGVIDRRVVLLDRKQVNLPVTVFVFVRTNQHAPDWLDSFAQAVADFAGGAGVLSHERAGGLPAEDRRADDRGV